MIDVNRVLNQIIISGSRHKKDTTVKCTKKILNYLDTLVSINAIEYIKVPYSNNLYKINIKYCNNKPILKRIQYIGNFHAGSVLKNQWKSEINSRRGIYISKTTGGLKLVFGGSPLTEPTSLLYKITIN